MNARFRACVWLLGWAALLSACNPAVESPAAEGVASPQAVALSLSTVDPQESLALFEYNRQAPLELQEERRWRQDQSTWIDFNYASPNGGRVPARMVIPDGKGPFPGLILMHGGPGTLEDMVDFARAFTGYGAVTLMITSPYRRPGGWEITQYMGNTWPLFTDRDIEIKIQTVVDLQRAVDILAARPEVDPQRMAYFGVSWGASMGGLLAGVEDRLVAYVLAAGDGGLVEHTADPGEDGLNIHFSEGWAARMWPTEPLHFVGLAAPAALLFQNGLYDTYVPPHDALRFYTAASEPKTIKWYPAGHGLPWQFVADAANWLQPYLGDRLFLLGPNYRRSAVYWEWGLIGMAALSGVVLGWDTVRRRSWDGGLPLLWLLAMLTLGPLGLAVYGLSSRQRADPTRPTPRSARWREILEVTTLAAMSFVFGNLLADQINALLLRAADFRLRFLQDYLTVLGVFWLLTLLTRRKYRTNFLANVFVVNVAWVAVNILPALLLEVQQVSFWLYYPVIALSVISVTYPLHAWLTHSGFERLVSSQTALVKPSRGARGALMALLLVSTLGIFWSVALVVRLYTGLTWGEVLRILWGGIS